MVQRNLRALDRDIQQGLGRVLQECFEDGNILVAQEQIKSANYTMTEGDSGLITRIDTDGVVITLPSTVLGYCYTFVNDGADGTVGINISPAALDKIMGNGFTSADDKDAINTKATAKKGDILQIIGDGADGWTVILARGVWEREG